MAQQSLRIDPRQWTNAVGAALGRGAEGGIKRAGLVVEKKAQNNAPVDTGSLRSSIASQTRGRGVKIVATVGPNVQSQGAPYDIYQEFGTGLHAETWDGSPTGSRHRIYPRTKKALSFNPKGKGFRRVSDVRTRVTKTTKFHGAGVTVKSVAGAPATHYMKKGFDETNVPEEFVRGFNAVRR